MLEQWIYGVVPILSQFGVGDAVGDAVVVAVGDGVGAAVGNGVGAVSDGVDAALAHPMSASTMFVGTVDLTSCRNSVSPLC